MGLLSGRGNPTRKGALRAVERVLELQPGGAGLKEGNRVDAGSLHSP
jgi:hypothetical protein